ncbi:hypothetical protein R50073_47720 [Maricurvus nonylphenolicus]|uniref:YHYH protein n=1 Tax=Maricurvus nonylphenolicus TaxID=1008307 RepID=UPI0036F373FA
MKVTSRQLALTSILMSCLPVSLLEARPPQEAFDACRNHDSGSSCTVSTPHGRLEGQCRQPPHESQLVCVPDGHRPGQARGSERESSSSRGPGGHTRNHTTIQSDGNPDLQAARQAPITDSQVDIVEQEPWRVLTSNGIAEHNTGRFPNRGNPNAIRKQQYQYRVPLQPKQSAQTTTLRGHSFGLAVNGVPFDPGAAEWYRGQRGQWQYEALSGAVPLGIDNNHAHVQPNGAYHYHGLPTGLMDKLNVTPAQHSALIGWAADGFPIYALYGYSDGSDTNSGIGQQTSSYRLKTGKRPSAGNNPGGHYDGTFIADYEYVEGQGSLDECNGRVTKTPEFPEGTYAYFLTEAWPVIPRCYKGTPSRDFTHERRR